MSKDINIELNKAMIAHDLNCEIGKEFNLTNSQYKTICDVIDQETAHLKQIVAIQLDSLKSYEQSEKAQRSNAEWWKSQYEESILAMSDVQSQLDSVKSEYDKWENIHMKELDEKNKEIEELRRDNKLANDLYKTFWNDNVSLQSSLLASEAKVKELEEGNKITRLEVINHNHMETKYEMGRALVSNRPDNKVYISLQDEGRTLKVFIEHKSLLTPKNKTNGSKH